MTHSIRIALVLAIAATLAVVSAQAQAPTVKRTVLLQHDTSVPGYEAVLVQVEIPAGGREGRHTHPGLAMIHVEEGTLTLDYEGKPTVGYKPGESFFVEAGKVHEGINKGTGPVKAIATFVVPKGQPITTQVAAATK
ncbi:MAG TPA: cupin domain-containing protein [Vicinamibacterales bacterium]|jgi:quercetin dioxygenase-like cupin family protein|nr:cupin domain-containing protein [Vicinamibacterales bacterium]